MLTQSLDGASRLSLYPHDFPPRALNLLTLRPHEIAVFGGPLNLCSLRVGRSHGGIP